MKMGTKEFTTLRYAMLNDNVSLSDPNAISTLR